MEPREFYDAVEYWSGSMTPGSVAGWDGLLEALELMRLEQKKMLGEYLRGLDYNRFLATRYWHAIRLKMRRDSRGRCNVCDEKRTENDIHHQKYDHRGFEYAHLGDLRFLCSKCHRILHGSSELVRNMS